MSDLLVSDPLVVAQDGLATVHQLRDLGCPSHVVAARCRPGGPWQRVLPRVVLLGDAGPDPHQRMRAALLYAGPDALLAGAAALALHRYGTALPVYVDVLVRRPAHRGSHAYVRVCRTRRPVRPVYVQGLACVPWQSAYSLPDPHQQAEVRAGGQGVACPRAASAVAY